MKALAGPTSVSGLKGKRRNGAFNASALDFISSVQTCMSSSTSAGSISLLVHVDVNFGFTGTTVWPFVGAAWFLLFPAAPAVSLCLNTLEKKGMAIVNVNKL